MLFLLKGPDLTNSTLRFRSAYVSYIPFNGISHIQTNKYIRKWYQSQVLEKLYFLLAKCTHCFIIMHHILAMGK